MSLFQRAHDIVAAKANKALDSAEDPNEMLDYVPRGDTDPITARPGTHHVTVCHRNEPDRPGQVISHDDTGRQDQPGQLSIPNRDILSLSLSLSLGPRSCELALPAHTTSFSRRGHPLDEEERVSSRITVPRPSTTRSERRSGQQNPCGRSPDCPVTTVFFECGPRSAFSPTQPRQRTDFVSVRGVISDTGKRRVLSS
jgi:hypothetical protein